MCESHIFCIREYVVVDRLITVFIHFLNNDGNYSKSIFFYSKPPTELSDRFSYNCKQWGFFRHISAVIQLLHPLWSVRWKSPNRSVGTCHVFTRASSWKICLCVHWRQFTFPCPVWSESIWRYVADSLKWQEGLMSRVGEDKLRNAQDDVIEWKHFPHYWTIVRGIHQSPVGSPHKGQWRVFVDLRLNKRLSKQSNRRWYGHRANYGVTVMRYASTSLQWRHNGAMASQITILTVVFSTFYSDTGQRKQQSSASLAFVRGIHRGPVNSPHKWPVTRKMFPFDDVIMFMYIMLLLLHESPTTYSDYEGHWQFIKCSYEVSWF